MAINLSSPLRRRTGVWYALGALVLILWCAGCVAVKPWERGYLAKKPMAVDPDPAESSIENTFLDAREGSAGGGGAVGGGCGCN